MKTMVNKGRLQNIAIVVLAISIGLSTYLYLSSLNSRAASNSVEIEAYVAIGDISAGTSFGSMLEQGSITLKRFPSNVISADAIRSQDDLSTAVISSAAINSGQFILKTMFAPAMNFASGLNIPRGDLAISISVDDVSRVANFVVPGSKVVIFSTVEDSQRGEALTRVLVSNALVLAIGTQVSTPNAGSQVSSSPLVTLAVNPIEASRIVHASQVSKLSLGLAHGNEPNSLTLPLSSISNSSLFRQD